MVWPRQKDARGENAKINYGLDTTGEKEKKTDWIPRERRKRGRPRKTWMEGEQTAMTTRNLEPDQWRNKEEWRFISRRRRQLLKNRTDRSLTQRYCLVSSFKNVAPYLSFSHVFCKVSIIIDTLQNTCKKDNNYN